MWHTHESCQYYLPEVQHVPTQTIKLAAFDLDSTLILSDKGERYATNGYLWAYANTVEMLRQLHSTGYTIAIFSNKKGPTWMINAAKARMIKIFAELQVPVYCFFATGSKKTDEYRKPGTKMMWMLRQLFGFTSFTSDSFYCGDAVGPSSSNRWFKWSSDDTEFAKAVGLAFYPPDVVFKEFVMPCVKRTTKLIMTIGQYGSGWECNLSESGKVIEFGDRYMAIIDSRHIRGELPFPSVEGKPDVIYYLLGEHPSAAERFEICRKFGLDMSAVEFHLYARPPYDETLSKVEFTKSFIIPDVYNRCN